MRGLPVFPHLPYPYRCLPVSFWREPKIEESLLPQAKIFWAGALMTPAQKIQWRYVNSG